MRRFDYWFSRDENGQLQHPSSCLLCLFGWWCGWILEIWRSHQGQHSSEHDWDSLSLCHCDLLLDGLWHYFCFPYEYFPCSVWTRNFFSMELVLRLLRWFGDKKRLRRRTTPPKCWFATTFSVSSWPWVFSFVDCSLLIWASFSPSLEVCRCLRCFSYATRFGKHDRLLCLPRFGLYQIESWQQIRVFFFMMIFML